MPDETRLTTYQTSTHSPFPFLRLAPSSLLHLHSHQFKEWLYDIIYISKHLTPVSFARFIDYIVAPFEWIFNYDDFYMRTWFLSILLVSLSFIHINEYMIYHLPWREMDKIPGIAIFMIESSIQISKYSGNKQGSDHIET